MTARPIIFSAPMVRALLAGRKTQTRRLATSPLRRCEVGDRLYVRETICLWSLGHDCEISYVDGARMETGPNTGRIPDVSLPGYFRLVDRTKERDGHAVGISSIHMPRWASRFTLTVTSVRVEPLQAISEADAEAEGVIWDSADGLPVWYIPGPPYLPHTATAPDCFAGLWRSLHTREGERWEDNPSICALTFTVERANIDQGERA